MQKKSICVLSSSEMALVHGGDVPDTKEVEAAVKEAEEVEKIAEGFFSGFGWNKTTVTIVSAITAVVVGIGYLYIKHVTKPKTA